MFDQVDAWYSTSQDLLRTLSRFPKKSHVKAPEKPLAGSCRNTVKAQGEDSVTGICEVLVKSSIELEVREVDVLKDDILSNTDLL